jgi:hypothetical protein
MSDNTCTFAAIDIDTQNDDNEVNFAEIARKVKEASLPLVMCRTRSGGAHLYLFLKSPAPAKQVRVLMQRWAAKVGVPVDLIVPDYDYQRTGKDGKPYISRSINLPYLGADKTDRYAFDESGKKKLKLTQFLDLAEQSRVDPSAYIEATDDLSQAPPCVQRMLQEGIPDGLRNEGLTQWAIFRKKQDPSDLYDRVWMDNLQVCDPPLKSDEVKKIVKSIGRSDYKYRCQSEPCKTYCDSTTCVKRKFGIKQGELDKDNAAGDLQTMLKFDSVRMVQQTESGGVYECKINGHTLVAPGRSLLHPVTMMLLCMEDLSIVLPAATTYKMLHAVMTPQLVNAPREIEADEDSTVGVIRSHFIPFAQRAKERDEGEDKQQYRTALNTRPIIEDGMVVFRMATYQWHCKQLRIDLPTKSVQSLADALRKIGMKSGKMRTPMGVIGIWRIDQNKIDTEEHYDEIEQPDPNSDY